MPKYLSALRVLTTLLVTVGSSSLAQADNPVDAKPPKYTAADGVWRLKAPHIPKDNQPTKARVELGEKLFFDPRLSRQGNMSCATCHNPSLGWSDGLKTAVGHNGNVLRRATPSIVNSAYSKILMWDGRHHSLESQAMGPMEAEEEMNSDFDMVFNFIKSSPEYLQMFDKAYPSEGVTKVSLSKALANFQRTVIVKNSPFDHWLAGNRNAITMEEWRGFQLFKGKAECVACHSAPNFSDDGFHNIGLKQWADPQADPGRSNIRKVKVNQGAFKTTSLRGIAETAPFFHDGSAATLMDVVEHYSRGGDVKTNLSPNLKPLDLTQAEKEDLVAFLKALSPKSTAKKVPSLPTTRALITE